MKVLLPGLIYVSTIGSQAYKDNLKIRLFVKKLLANYERNYYGFGGKTLRNKASRRKGERISVNVYNF